MDVYAYLFDKYALIPPDSPILISHLDDAHLIRDLSQNASHVDVYHRDWAQIQRFRQQLDGDAQLHVHEQPLPDMANLQDVEPRYGVALVRIPKGRDYARAVLTTALALIKPKGYVFAIGANKGGAKTAETDMQALAPTRTLGTKARHRILSIYREKNLTLPTEDAPWQMRPLEIHLRDEIYKPYTQPGIFSWEHLDEGTRFLLEYLPDVKFSSGLKILDAGCGYGIVGMVAQRELQPEQVVWVDNDLLAVQCVKHTLPDASVLAADLMASLASPPAPFDVILCNPPFHKEHQQNLDFIQHFSRRAKMMLRRRGRLFIVANSFLPYDGLLTESFTTVLKVKDNDRFQILEARVY